MIPREQFEAWAAEEFPKAVPEKFHPLIKNVVFLVEDEPDAEVRREEELGPGETLLGLYRGIPSTARGDLYGVGMTLPDSIHLYQLPIEEEARFLMAQGVQEEEAVRKVVRETIWHEVAHHFGMDEHEVRRREDERDQHSHS